MIIDNVRNLNLYKEVLPNVENGLNKLADVKEFVPGERVYFDGGFFFYQKGTTKPLADAQFEAHRKYIDVQILLSGQEYLAWSELEHLTPVMEYSEERDVQKFTGEARHAMAITANMAYVCFPSDGHQAVFHLEEPTDFEKIVMKLEV